MNSYLKVLSRIPAYTLNRQFGWPKTLPMNLTLSVSPRCNSHCLTCNIWQRRDNVLSLREWETILKSLGTMPFWITISGGEPFIYHDLVEFCDLVYRYCQPALINIPTNGLAEKIPEQVKAIAANCPKAQIIINVSLDGVESEHDRIRGVPGAFEKTIRTLKSLLALRDQTANLQVGIHSVISTFNIDQVNQILSYVDQTGVDQFISEMAEERVELGTLGLPISPKLEDYLLVLDTLQQHLKASSYKRISRITQNFRLQYYRLVQRILVDRTQVIPCYAGWSSAQIYADGTVWPCCVRADPLGNLRNSGYDFPRIWFGETSEQVRKSIANKECYCPLANAAYTNMLQHVPTLLKVGRDVAAQYLQDRINR